MSVTLQLDLPDALVSEARERGLFRAEQLGDLLTTELQRRRAADGLLTTLAQLRDQPGVAPSAEEIATEIEAARTELRRREAGR
jgi:hypothetical protein